MIDFSKVSLGRGLMITLIIFAIIAPPCLSILLFEHQLFLTLDIFKLLLASTIVGIPFYIGSLFFVLIMHLYTEGKNNIQTDEELAIGIPSLAIALTLLIWLLTAIICYVCFLIGNKITSIWVLNTSIITFLLTIIFPTIFRVIKLRKQKNLNNFNC